MALFDFLSDMAGNAMGPMQDAVGGIMDNPIADQLTQASEGLGQVQDTLGEQAQAVTDPLEQLLP